MPRYPLSKETMHRFKLGSLALALLLFFSPSIPIFIGSNLMGLAITYPLLTGLCATPLVLCSDLVSRATALDSRTQLDIQNTQKEVYMWSILQGLLGLLQATLAIIAFSLAPQQTNEQWKANLTSVGETASLAFSLMLACTSMMFVLYKQSLSLQPSNDANTGAAGRPAAAIV